MLRLKNVTKTYKVADMEVHALKGVSISFRENEFVSILGPSGCGKTTALNIIGGLDQYTTGDLFINGVSTKDFKDRDWDVYRNHRIGFIFQSYNLIPHQTILGNVELALTISGLSKQERVEKAMKALDKVGLAGQYKKKPNQLSGGQCQRVAIARALVNEPEILLADEPTGALDTVTSVQIMELIKEIAKEKLVIMVTHNPDLAEQYSTRIVRLLDGEIIEDTNPYSEEDEIKDTETRKEKMASELKKEQEESVKGKKKVIRKEKAKMSMWTAFKLSARNLYSKMKRTVLVVIAGSIGIIGVASVLSVSQGVNDYINSMQDDLLSGNPVTVSKMAIDMETLVGGNSFEDNLSALEKGDWVNVRSIVGYLVTNQKALESLVSNNEITKDYIDYILSMPEENYNAISLDYGVDFTASIYTDFTNNAGDTKTMSINSINQTYAAAISMLGTPDGSEEGQYGKYSSAITALTSPINQSVPNNDYILSQYDVVAGSLPSNENECIMVLNSDEQVTDLALAQLGYYSQKEFFEMVYNKMNLRDPNGNEYTSKDKFTYEEIMRKEFTWYDNNTIYEMDIAAANSYQTAIANAIAALKAATTEEEKIVASKELERAYTQYLNAEDLYDYHYEVDSSWKNGTKLTISGIVKPKDTISYGCLKAGLLYTEQFARNAVKQNVKSNIVNLVKSTRTVDMGGQSYNVGIKIAYQLPYTWESILGSSFSGNGVKKVYVGQENAMTSIAAAYGLSSSGSSSASMTLTALGGNTDKDGNIIPESILIYPIDFEQKNKVTDYLNKWNKIEREESEDVTFTIHDDDLNPVMVDGVVQTKTLTSSQRTEIKYTDNVELIINMINTMINIVTYALVAFTALSLVVSTVMVGIITYVSVVERTKEIGVIRSLGGRKKDVSHLFNAETFMIGLASGVFGVLVTLLISLIINILVNILSGGLVTAMARLTPLTAIIMITISVLLTLISGLIPAKSAANNDPVVALRSE